MRAAETSDLNKEGLTMGYTENLIDFIGKVRIVTMRSKPQRTGLTKTVLRNFLRVTSGMYKAAVNITLYEIRHQ